MSTGEARECIRLVEGQPRQRVIVSETTERPLLLSYIHQDRATTNIRKEDPMTITTISIPDGTDEDLLTLAEVAAILRVPIATVRWWRQLGEGPAFFKIGRHLVTTIGDLRTWINAQKHTALDQARPRTDR